MDTARAAKAPGVRAVLTGNDVRGIIYGRRYRDISVLAQDKVRFMGERVAAIAADTLEQAEHALELIQVDYEELPAVFDPIAALQEGAPIIHPDLNSYKGLPEKFAKPTNRSSRCFYPRRCRGGVRRVRSSSSKILSPCRACIRRFSNRIAVWSGSTSRNAFKCGRRAKCRRGSK